MSESHEAGQVGDARAILEDLGGHAVALALVEASASTATDDAGRILTAVLEKVESIMHFDRSRLRLRVAVNHSNDTTHDEDVSERGR
jgi:hypothetical protein